MPKKYEEIRKKGSLYVSFLFSVVLVYEIDTVK